jgi:hypothetical protein
MDIKLAKQFLALPKPKDEVITMAQLADKHVKKPMDKKYLYKYTIYGVWG